MPGHRAKRSLNKGRAKVNEVTMDPNTTCQSCRIILLSDFHIHCVECTENTNINTNICLECFSEGKQFGSHLASHSYSIIKDVQILAPDWDSKEELALIHHLEKYGLGNWDDAPRSIKGRSAEQCRLHYFREYIDKPCSELDFLKSQDKSSAKTKLKIEISHEVNTLKELEVLKQEPGSCLDEILMDEQRHRLNIREKRKAYRLNHDSPEGFVDSTIPQRSPDFLHHGNEGCGKLDSIFNNVDLTASTDESVSTLETELQAALVDIYHRNLKDQARPKLVFQEHESLITDLEENNISLEPQFTKILPKILPLISSEELSNLFHGCELQSELQEKILTLKEHRENGLKSFSSVEIFNSLCTRREQLKDMKNRFIQALDSDISPLNTLDNENYTSTPPTVISFQETGDQEITYLS